jgi:hypothetical protein
MFGLVNATHGFPGPAGLAAGLLAALLLISTRTPQKSS